jgi:hypothetical protein
MFITLKLVVQYTFAQILVYAGIVLRTQEVLYQIGMLVGVKVRTQEVHIPLFEHPVGHLAGNLTVVTGQRKDVALKGHLPLLQMMIEPSLLPGIIEIALGMSQNQVPTVLLQPLDDLVKGGNRMRKASLDEKMISRQRTQGATGVTVLALSDEIQETLVDAILKAIVLAIDVQPFLEAFFFQLVEDRLDDLRRVHKPGLCMMRGEDDPLHAIALQGGQEVQ